MDKSRIMANLEERLEPVPKNKRTALKMSKGIYRWEKHIKESEIFLKDEKNRLDAYVIGFYSALLDMLSTAENREVMAEAKMYFNSKKHERSVKSNKDFSRGLSWWLSEMAEITEGMLGVKAEKPLIVHNPKGNVFQAGSYLPASNAIIINGNLRYVLPDIVAHEYLHHIQYSLKNQMKWAMDYILKEGMAYGFGISASFEYASRTGNKICHAESSMWASFYLASAISLLDEDKQKRKTCRERDVEHYPGIAAFLTAEAKHGKSIYREIIRSANPAEYLIKRLD